MSQQKIMVACLVLVAIFLFVASLYYLSWFLVPVVYGMVLAMLFLPLSRFLERKRFPRPLAIVACLLIIILALGSVGWLVYTQVVAMARDINMFETKAVQKFDELKHFVEHVFHISVDKQTTWLKENDEKMLKTGSSIVGLLLLGLSGGFELLLVLLIYTFLFLLTRDRIKQFAIKIVPKQSPDYVSALLSKTELMTRKYVSGTLQIMAIIAVLNTIGFMICGVKQAIFWGIVRGLLNIIPYVGAILGGIFPFLSAMVYHDSLWNPAGVVLTVIITQMIQDYYILPKIVGSYIKLNPLTTISCIVVGHLLWGIHGMVLLLPLVGIAKILCDNIPALHAVGYLLGDEQVEGEVPDRVR